MGVECHVQDILAAIHAKGHDFQRSQLVGGSLYFGKCAAGRDDNCAFLGKFLCDRIADSLACAGYFSRMPYIVNYLPQTRIAIWSKNRQNPVFVAKYSYPIQD